MKQDQHYPGDTVVGDSLKYLKAQLPLPATKLDTQIVNIPEGQRTTQLLRKIHALNKKMILQQFQQLCTQIGTIYVQYGLKQKKDFNDVVSHIMSEVLEPYKFRGSLYSKRLSKGISRHHKSQSNHQNLTNILWIIAAAHYENFQLGLTTLSMMTLTHADERDPIPEKYAQTIEGTVHSVLPEPKELESQRMKTMKADENAMMLTNTLAKKMISQIDTDEKGAQHGGKDESKSKKKKKGEKGLGRITGKIMKAFSFQKSGKKDRSSQSQVSDLNHDNQYQDKINLLVLALQGQKEQKTATKTFDIRHTQSIDENESTEVIDQFLGLEGALHVTSQQLNMIGQLTDMMLKHKDQFDAKHIKQEPFLSSLARQVANQTKELKDQSHEVLQFSGELKKDNVKKPQMGQNSNHLTKAITSVNHKIKGFLNKTEQVDISVDSINSDPFQNHYQFLIHELEAFHSQLKHSHSFFGGNDPQKYNEEQSWTLTIMLLYQSLALGENKFGEKYTPLRRRTFIKIFKNMFNPTQKNQFFGKSTPPSFKNWPTVLKGLENERPEVLNTKNPEICSEATRIFDYLLKNLNSPNGGKASHIFDGGVQKFQKQLPSMKLVCLSKGNKEEKSPNCKVVHLFISGFLSEDTDKLQEWADLVDIMPDSQIYALMWQSDTIKNLVLFLLKSTKDILFAAKLSQQLKRKYSDNPFIPAFAVAQITGRILAEMVSRLFPNKFIDIIGYSLGTEVIKQFVSRTIQLGHESNLNNIYLMGGVSDAKEITKIISESPSPLSVKNCYTKYDAVLKHLLSLCKPEITPIGLHDLPKVPGHEVMNINCSKFISGHLAFRSHMDLMGEVLEMSIG